MILHSKFVILLGLCLVFVIFLTLLLSGLLFFYFVILHSKSIMLIGLCPVFVGGFHPFSSVVFKWNNQLIWKMMIIYFSEYLYVPLCWTSTRDFIPFILKYLIQLRITSKWQKAAASGSWRWFYLKYIWYLKSANYWAHRNGKKKQHFNYYKLCIREAEGTQSARIYI